MINTHENPFKVIGGTQSERVDILLTQPDI